MPQNPTDQSTNQTPGSVPASGSGSAPLIGDRAGDGELAAGTGYNTGSTGHPIGTGAELGRSSTAGDWKESLADRLEAGASRLESGGGPSDARFAGATAGDGSIALDEGDGRFKQIGGKVAEGMKSTANWIREADIEGLREGVEKQVREHPARSLLIALGVGYLIGKAVRK